MRAKRWRCFQEQLCKDISSAWKEACDSLLLIYRHSFLLLSSAGVWIAAEMYSEGVCVCVYVNEEVLQSTGRWSLWLRRQLPPSSHTSGRRIDFNHPPVTLILLTYLFIIVSFVPVFFFFFFYSHRPAAWMMSHFLLPAVLRAVFHFHKWTGAKAQGC